MRSSIRQLNVRLTPIHHSYLMKTERKNESVVCEIRIINTKHRLKLDGRRLTIDD